MGRSVSTPSGAAVTVYASTSSSYYCRTCAHCREAEPEVDSYDADCPRCIAANRIPDIQFDDGTTRINWECDMESLSSALRAAFPSLREADRWMGREDHVVLENSLAAITVSEYCGLVAVCLVPERRDSYETRDDDPLSLRWIAAIERRFRKIVADIFGIGA